MNLLRATGTIGGLTLVSRILGFVRDMLFARFAGAGLASDCFLIAFRLPNLFRALFAEGAFASAFVPMFSRQVGEHDGDTTAAKRFAEEALSVLLPVLALFTALMMIAAGPVVYAMTGGFPGASPQKFALAVELTRVTFPYLLLISLVSLLGGILNSLQRFWVNAAAPILLNLSLIGGLVVFHSPTEIGTARVQAAAVTVAGIAQFVWLLWACLRADVRLRLRAPQLTPAVRRLLAIIWPAALGAGAVQFNLLVSTALAARFLPEGAVSYLYYADRLNQLPLGLVGIGVGTALLPTLARQLGAKNDAVAMHTQNRAIELVLLLTLPAAAALVVSALPMIQDAARAWPLPCRGFGALRAGAGVFLARIAGLCADQGADAGLLRPPRYQDAGADRGRLDAGQSRRQRRADLVARHQRYRGVDRGRRLGQRRGIVVGAAPARPFRCRRPAEAHHSPPDRRDGRDGRGARVRQPLGRAVHDREPDHPRGGAGAADWRGLPGLRRRLRAVPGGAACRYTLAVDAAWVTVGLELGARCRI